MTAAPINPVLLNLMWDTPFELMIKLAVKARKKDFRLSRSRSTVRIIQEEVKYMPAV